VQHREVIGAHESTAAAAGRNRQAVVDEDRILQLGYPCPEV
jgi:hypothetical protein